MERLPKALHTSVRRVLRQAWELDDPGKAEKLLRNLAQRLERDWSGVASSILEGIDEILCRNVKRWRSASMAMRWTAATMQEAAKGFRRLKAHKQLPALRAALDGPAPCRPRQNTMNKLMQKLSRCATRKSTEHNLDLTRRSRVLPPSIGASAAIGPGDSNGGPPRRRSRSCSPVSAVPPPPKPHLHRQWE
jgi:hypothetical protein